MAESRAEKELREMASATEFVAADGFRLGGEAGEAGEAGPGGLAERLAAALRRRFFERRAGPAIPGGRVAGWRHLEALSAAHGRRRVWQGGFRVAAVGAGTVTAIRDGVAYEAPATQVRGAAGAPELGEEVMVRVPGELRHLVPEHFFVLADPSAPAGAEEVLLRLYWNLGPAGAVAWLAGLGERLAPAGVRWEAKALRDPAAYGRADAAVLYLAKKDWPAARRPLAELYRELRRELTPCSPFLTRELAPGLGLAEGFVPSERYGADCCRLVAGALIAAARSGRRPGPELGSAFRAAGREPRAPWRLAGGAGLDPLPPARRRAGRGAPAAAVCTSDSPSDSTADSTVVSAVATAVSAAVSTGGSGGSGGSADGSVAGSAAGAAASFTAAALALGRHLAATAHLAAGRANWLAPGPPAALLAAGGEVALASLGPGLGDGLSGIALFLAELFLATGEPAAGAVGRAAAGQALRQLSVEPGRAPWGFLEGGLGAAWALRRVAAALGDDPLAAPAAAALDRLHQASPRGEAGSGLARGAAGTILVLLDLAAGTGDEAWLAAAREEGEKLLRAPEAELSWPAGLALLALAGAGGGPDLRATGRRILEAAEDRGDAVAAALALARLRAAGADPVAATEHRAAARRHLATVLGELDRQAGDVAADASLGRGVALSAGVTFSAAAALADAGLAAAAAAAMRRQVSLHVARGSWPSGLPTREATPVYLAGLAGIGHLLLRLDGHARLPCPPLLDFLPRPA